MVIDAADEPTIVRRHTVSTSASARAQSLRVQSFSLQGFESAPIAAPAVQPADSATQEIAEVTRRSKGDRRRGTNLQWQQSNTFVSDEDASIFPNRPQSMLLFDAAPPLVLATPPTSRVATIDEDGLPLSPTVRSPLPSPFGPDTPATRPVGLTEAIQEDEEEEPNAHLRQRTAQPVDASLDRFIEDGITALLRDMENAFTPLLMMSEAVHAGNSQVVFGSSRTSTLSSRTTVDARSSQASTMSLADTQLHIAALENLYRETEFELQATVLPDLDQDNLDPVETPQRVCSAVDLNWLDDLCLLETDTDGPISMDDAFLHCDQPDLVFKPGATSSPVH